MEKIKLSYVVVCLVILGFMVLVGRYGLLGRWYAPNGPYGQGKNLMGGSLNMPEGKNVTLYYAPWCGYCKKLMPEWNKVEQSLRGDSTIKISKINCDENPKLAQREGVKGYPTIILETRDQKTIYNGKHTADAILSFIKSF